MNRAVIACVFLLPLVAVHGLFPAACNNQQSLTTKTCCPDNCGGSTRGSCVNITERVINQWNSADQTIVDILKKTPMEERKGNKADSRYLWPTVVFENVCECSGNYGGYNCLVCDYGWTGDDCQTRKELVVRRSFSSLSETEKSEFISATRNLKTETGVWSVVVDEPLNYDTGTVTLQDVSTYDMFVYMHAYVAREDKKVCKEVNDNNIVDFAHEGPVFPIWHRRYLLILEREYQRIMGDDSFGLPYWKWEKNDMSLLTPEYFGSPNTGEPEDVAGDLFMEWYTICDLGYREPMLDRCTPYWEVCNPQSDAANRNKLQRGLNKTRRNDLEPIYVPNERSVMMAIAAPSIDAVSSMGKYGQKSPRDSFRSRLEGWNRICSGNENQCVGNRVGKQSHMHNVVHLWLGGHMSRVPAAANDPIFSTHHSNIDRIFESWIQRFSGNSLPDYEPTRRGHPGQNRDDYMVPFFPLIDVNTQYKAAEEWGYTYDNLVAASINDDAIDDCITSDPCTICRADGTCFDIPIPTPTTPGGNNGSVGLGFDLLVFLLLLASAVALVFS